MKKTMLYLLLIVMHSGVKTLAAGSASTQPSASSAPAQEGIKKSAEAAGKEPMGSLFVHPLDKNFRFSIGKLTWKFRRGRWKLAFIQRHITARYHVDRPLADFKREIVTQLSEGMPRDSDFYFVKNFDSNSSDDKSFKENDMLQKLRDDKNASVKDFGSRLGPSEVNFWGHSTNEYTVWAIPKLAPFLAEKQKQEEELKKKAAKAFELKQQKTVEFCFAAFR